MQNPPPIIHTPLPLYAMKLPVLFIMAVFGIGMGGYVAGVGIAGGSPWLGTLLGIVACAAFVGLGVLHKKSLQRRTTPHVPREVEASDFAFRPELRHAAAQLIDLPWRERQVDCSVALRGFVAECKRLGLQPPRTVMHTSLAARLSALDRPNVGMEPEAILGSGDSPPSIIWLWVVGAGAVSALLALNRNWFSAGVMLLAAGAFAFGSIPALRDRFRILRWDDGNLVAGMGVIKDARDDRTWTVNDAVMIVRTKEPVGALFVRFVGEAGVLRLTFVDEHDPDFVKLWQRWNHPQPRPDLFV